MIVPKNLPFRSRACAILSACALGCFAALLPASLSAAPSKITIGFDTNGNNEGFVGYNATTANAITLTTASGLVSGTAIGGDPRIIKNSNTAFFTKPSAASWQTIVFRVRETDESSAVVSPYDGSGVLVAVNSSNSGSALTTGSAYSSVDSGDGFFTVTANISGFTANEIKYFRVDPIGGTDAAGNKFEVDFIEVNVTNTPPALVSTSPVDGATQVSSTANLVATFDEPIFLGATGSITIKNLTNPSDTVISLPGPDADGTLSVSGNQLTIDPAAGLVPSSEYAIEISADAIKDAENAAYAGILSTDVPNWSFTTNTPPQLLSTSPADGASGVSPIANLIVTFNELISLNTTGSVKIKNLTTATETVISLPGPDPDGTLSVFPNQLSINPAADLLPGNEYAIEISADAIKDVENLFYAGILSTDVPNWSFTIDNLPPAPAYFHPLPGSGNAPLNGALFIAFDENVLAASGKNLALYRADNTLVETIAVTSPNVAISGALVTITPTVPLAYGTSYYVLIDSGAFTDAWAAQVHAGISNSAVWTFTTLVNDPKILFGDSFNRPDGTALNASSTGKYGSLGALNHTSRIIGGGNIQLSAGQLLSQSNLPAGTSGGLVYINHNFTNPAITSGGGFSITVDINSYSTAGSGRYMSVGVGQSSTELDGQTTASLGSTTVADLAVGYRGTNSTLEIRKNGGAPIATAGLPAVPAKMRIDYAFSDFNAGSTVNFSVFFNDSVTAFTSGTFTWSGANENYISLSSNLFLEDFTLDARNALFDNLQIRLKQAPAADNYLSWANSQLPPVTGGENGDDDNDGVKNLVEYALVNGGERGVFSGNTITFTKRGAPYGGDLTYIIETSETLSGSWLAEVTHGPAQLGLPISYALTPVPGTPRKFARLKVTGP